MPFHPSGRCSERNVRMRSRNASASGVYVGFMTQNLPVAAGSADADVEPGGAPCERGGTDQWPRIAEPAADDAGSAREVEPGRRVDLRLRGGEEHVAEPERDRAGHARQPEVEQVRHRRDGLTDQPSGTDADGLIGVVPPVAR